MSASAPPFASSEVPKPVTYRDATLADAVALNQLFRHSFAATFGHLYAPADLAAFLAGFTPERWADELASPDFAFRIAEQDGAAVGYAKLGPEALPIKGRGPAIELRQLYLAEAAKGTGVAHELMDWAIATARARGAVELWLSVFTGNPRARQFYDRYGFKDAGPYAFMVGSHADEDRLMRLDLAWIMSEPIDLIPAHALAGMPHGFLGRRGGVSTGVAAGLNVGLGSADDPAAVAENRRRAAAAVLPGAALVTVYQVHGADVVTAAHPWPDAARPRADALVTDRPGLLLGILTADCAPVLLADRQAGVIGAAHAGWKGALAGVTDATVDAMEALGADRARIAAAIGPCISRASYEVDDAFLARFADADPENERFFADARPGHHRFDLEAYVAHRLAGAGIGRVEALGLDTYALEDRFYSFRRATHRREPDYGRQIALIGLP